MRQIVILFALSLCGCPQLPPVSDCQPFSTRCSADGTPQTCSGSQRWTSSQDTPCQAPAVCCRTDSPYNEQVFACAAESDCVGNR